MMQKIGHVTPGSVLDALLTKHPEVRKQINDDEIWNYSVYGPMSLDDQMYVTVRITFGKEHADKTVEYTLGFKEESNGQSPKPKVAARSARAGADRNEVRPSSRVRLANGKRRADPAKGTRRQSPAKHRKDASR